MPHLFFYFFHSLSTFHFNFLTLVCTFPCPLPLPRARGPSRAHLHLLYGLVISFIAQLVCLHSPFRLRSGDYFSIPTPSCVYGETRHGACPGTSMGRARKGISSGRDIEGFRSLTYTIEHYSRVQYPAKMGRHSFASRTLCTIMSKRIHQHEQQCPHPRRLPPPSSSIACTYHLPWP